MLLFWSFGLVGFSKKMHFKSTSSQRVHLNKSQRKISFLSLRLVCLPHIDSAPFMFWPFSCYTTENTWSHDWFSCLLRISQKDDFIFLELMTLSGNFLTYISHRVCSIACYLNWEQGVTNAACGKDIIISWVWVMEVTTLCIFTIIRQGKMAS